MAEAPEQFAVDEPSISPATIVLIVVGLFVCSVLGGLVALYWYKEQHADELGFKKKKKVSARKQQRDRAKYTQMGD
eukprot:CAMPEP_0177714942 /NCGR_PEP_ID=MMETSP0484_2-20121128/13719_1 /TAXON_ID=354590 /ORGANISM="Rhodomonas lens, Strain RHODO" /LENGTH=75 /DNA_ID=CAMNT_0019226887 /DNA_START=19 /DNA_END=246 /DNA_ORIENTATION=+